MDKILGFEKLSLVDFDGLVACTIFIGNCNFRCPFCHNSSLVLEGNSLDGISENEIFSYLESRKKMIDAVCISGGEPTLYKDLFFLIDKIKKMGYKVKLDTNGSNYNVLKELIDKKMIDYVAMDVKNGLSSYKDIIGVNNDNLINNVIKSIDLLKKDVIDYEFRTTLVKEFHSEKDILEIGELIKGSKQIFLQKFVDRGTCIKNNLHEIDNNTVSNFKVLLERYVDNVYLRGY